MLTTAISTTNAQQKDHPYLSLFDTNKVWYHVRAEEFGGWGVEELSINYENNILNVNDTLYYTISANGYSSYGYYREDTLTKKIYERWDENNPEEILYDFSLQEGDSIGYRGSGVHWYYIDSLRNINIFDVDRKIWYLKSKNQYNQEYVYPIWIEGIGSTCSIIYPSAEPTLDWMLLGLTTCVFQDDNLIFQSNYGALYGYSFEYVDINEISENNISFYPNPITNISVLKFLNKNNELFFLEIYDITGKLVYRDEINSNQFQISKCNFLNGIYLYQLKTNNKIIYTNKFIVQ